MPSIYGLKPAFQRLLRPLVAGLVRAGLTANGVTLAAVALSAAVGATIALRPTEGWPYLLLPAALFVRMALNAVDGMMAREHGQASALGALLNELGDVVSDAALYLPLAFHSAVAPSLIVGVVLLAVIGEMTGVTAQAIGASRRYDGPAGKSDRAFYFGGLGLYLGLGGERAGWVSASLLIVLVLLVITVVNRGRKALLELREVEG